VKVVEIILQIYKQCERFLPLLSMSMMGIHVLSSNVIHALVSSQKLVDPVLVIKELIDNAIDANASSVTIDISADTIDVIQVKDNGCGVAPIDRQLLVKCNHTSKINNEQDLQNVQGKTLGFRGQALSYMAEMSESIKITTRVEGEDMASFLVFARDGKLLQEKSKSHAIGSTVRVEGFANSYPVRKQNLVTQSEKTIAGIKLLLQRYAIARPRIRFLFSIIKGSDSKHRRMYAPNMLYGTLLDTVSKVVGKDTANQCQLVTGTFSDIKIQAVLPKTGANADHLFGVGEFVTIDGRPLGIHHGTGKRIVQLVKEHSKWIQKMGCVSRSSFICLSVDCRAISYDVNIEPSKDDVLFDDWTVIANAIQSLLFTAYSTMEIGNDQGLSTPLTESCKIATTANSQIVPIKANCHNFTTSDGVNNIVSSSSPVSTTNVHRKLNEGLDPWVLAKINTTIRQPYASWSDVECANAVQERVDATSMSTTARLTPFSSSPGDSQIPRTQHYSAENAFYATPQHDPHRVPYPTPGSGHLLNERPARCSEVQLGLDSPWTMIRAGNTMDLGGSPLHMIPSIQTKQPKQSKAKQKPFKCPIPRKDSERDAWFDIPDQNNHNNRRRKQKVSNFNETTSSQSQIAFETSSQDNRDIRSYMRGRNDGHEDMNASQSMARCDDRNLDQSPPLASLQNAFGAILTPQSGPARRLLSPISPNVQRPISQLSNWTVDTFGSSPQPTHISKGTTSPDDKEMTKMICVALTYSCNVNLEPLSPIAKCDYFSIPDYLQDRQVFERSTAEELRDIAGKLHALLQRKWRRKEISDHVYRYGTNHLNPIILD